MNGGHTEIYGSGTTPKTSDSQRMLLVKILGATTTGGSGSNIVGAYGGVAPGVTPTGVTWAKDSDTGKLWFYDGTTWTDTGITI